MIFAEMLLKFQQILTGFDWNLKTEAIKKIEKI